MISGNNLFCVEEKENKNTIRFCQIAAELRSCVNFEVDVLGSRP